MKKYFKGVSISVIAVSLGVILVSCDSSNDGKSSFTLNGDYSNDAVFSPGSYIESGAKLNLTTTTAKFTCPSGYAVPSVVTAPSYGSDAPEYTCNRQGGCEVKELGSGATGNLVVLDIPVEQNDTITLATNDSIEVSVGCAKVDQVNDWTL